MITYKNISINEELCSVRKDGRLVHLTKTQYRLFLILLEHAGQICTREYLLSSVWHIKTPLLTRRVDAYITLLRKKLGLGKNELKCVMGHGYVLAEDNDTSTPYTQE